MALTADVPKVARMVGRGIIMLAKFTGRPIVPVAMTTSRRFELNNWDRSTINLPFSRVPPECMGELIRVPSDADDQQIEMARVKLQEQLEAVTARARAWSDSRRGETARG